MQHKKPSQDIYIMRKGVESQSWENDSLTEIY